MRNKSPAVIINVFTHQSNQLHAFPKYTKVSSSPRRGRGSLPHFKKRSNVLFLTSRWIITEFPLHYSPELIIFSLSPASFHFRFKLPIPPTGLVDPTAPHESRPSAADNVSRPGLVYDSRLEVSYGRLHRLDLLVFGRDGADLVAHLVALHWHILALDAGGEEETQIQSF